MHDGVWGASTYDDICGVSISLVYGARCGGNYDGPLPPVLVGHTSLELERKTREIKMLRARRMR